MNIIAWIIFGLIVGVIANFLDPRPAKGGVLGAVVLGVAGALLGGFLSNLLFGVPLTGFDFRSFVIAIIGSLVLLFAGRTFQREV